MLYLSSLTRPLRSTFRFLARELVDIVKTPVDPFMPGLHGGLGRRGYAKLPHVQRQLNNRIHRESAHRRGGPPPPT